MTKMKTKQKLPLFDEKSLYHIGIGDVLNNTRYAAGTVDRIKSGDRKPSINFIEKVTLNLRVKKTKYDEAGNDITNEFYTSKNLFGEEYADIVP